MKVELTQEEAEIIYGLVEQYARRYHDETGDHIKHRLMTSDKSERIEPAQANLELDRRDAYLLPYRSILGKVKGGKS